MRISVELDDELLAKAKKVTGLKRTNDVVNEGLRRMVLASQREALEALRGLAHWEGDLRSFRRDRDLPQ